MRIIETVLCAAFLTGCAPKGNSNPNINLERAQQTLDSLYVHYSVPNTCLLRENFPLTRSTKSLIWHQKNKLTCQTPIRISGLTPEHSPQ